MAAAAVGGLSGTTEKQLRRFCKYRRTRCGQCHRRLFPFQIHAQVRLGPPRHCRNGVEIGEGERSDRTARRSAHDVSHKACGNLGSRSEDQASRVSVCRGRPIPDPLPSVMTRIDFYSNAEPKLQVACRLVAKIIQQHSRVFVYAPDEDTARGFDKLLWTYQAIGFVPHCMAHHALSSETPVVIACEDAERSEERRVGKECRSGWAPEAETERERDVQTVASMES